MGLSVEHQTQTLLTLNVHYGIRVPGWLLKSLNLITEPGSVSDQALKKSVLSGLKNHIEKITKL